jgi:hypothetical protein
MKLITLIFLSFSCLSTLNADAQTSGSAIEFSHDAIGNRILRHHNPSAIILKQGVTPRPEDTSIQKFVNDQLVIKAYPNPVDDYITVENLSWKDGDNVVAKLFDITGKLITTKNFSSAKSNVPFSGIAPGTYQLHYYLNGQLLTNWKIVKH